MKRPTDSIDAFERAAKSAKAKAPHYILRLYIAGATRQSSRAIESIQSICEERLHGQYELEVVDVYQHPSAAREDQVVALPTLIKRLPLPLRQLIGDLSNTKRVLLGLDLKPKAKSDAKKAPSRKARQS
jgi:circadian clock protein KaiB